ncbi:MAG: RHS repeat-associated core domain-containing protein [Planctomycetes bacterium]|nr:RHS repeat-associated core domain-containing protein [Planctomycetota bacterium]
MTYAREFRYDAARARYLNRELDPDLISADPPDYITDSATWSDYDGDTIYGDFAVDEQTGALTEARSFEPGLATVDPWTASGGASTKHFTTNHLGTTRGLTNSSGSAVDSATYTAFGERIDGTNHRYGYAGAWGYQAHDDFPYVHVGARYYDPATGRFLQRDPIGIRGGLNVYEYVRNGPTISIDPDGLRYRPPKATGPSDRGFFDGFWTGVHYTAGWGAAKSGIRFSTTMRLAIRWERWEPDHWPGFNESWWNQLGDIVAAGMGWVDAHL